MNSMKNILRISFSVLISIAFSLVTTQVVEAKTITNTNDFVSDEMLTYFENVYVRSKYKNYLLSSEYYGDRYDYTTYYYICLTNEDITMSDGINASANCEEMYRVYRSNYDYVFEKINDNSLSINNSVYYTNGVIEKSYISEKMLIALNIGVFTFFLVYVLFKMFRS